MSDSTIRQLFEKRLIDWCEARGIPVATENHYFDPPAGASLEDLTHVRCWLLPATPSDLFLDGTHTVYTGVFQINAITAKGIGTGLASALAEEIKALFPLNDVLKKDNFRVQVMTVPATATGIPGDSYYVVPISFTYRGEPDN